jgi:hypothetical protein
MIAGTGGVNYRRGADVAAAAVYLALQRRCNLLFTATSLLMPLPVPPHMLEHDNISIVYDYLSRDQVLEELQASHVVL